MRVLHFLALTPLAFVAFNGQDPAVAKHVEALQKAQSLEATITVTLVGGSTREDTLSLSKPNKLRWENASTLVVGDGTTLWTYDKAKKAYTKTASSPEAIGKVLSPEAVFAYSAFFNEKFGELVKSATKGNARKARGADVVDYAVTLVDGRTMTVSFNQANGVAWGSKYVAKGTTADTIALVKEFKVGEGSLADSLFAWTPPADAKDAAEAPAADPNAVKYADIKSILDSNCLSCHGGRGAKAGVDVSSYEALTSGRSVVPGNANGSRLVRAIKSGRMPPKGPLAAGDQDKIAQWVDGGAQK